MDSKKTKEYRSMLSWDLKEIDGGVQFKIKVQPRSSKNQFCGLSGEALKIKLTAPPVDGEANEACLKFIARSLGVSRSQVKLVSGLTNPHKTIRIEDITREQLLQRLDGLQPDL